MPWESDVRVGLADGGGLAPATPWEDGWCWIIQKGLLNKLFPRVRKDK